MHISGWGGAGGVIKGLKETSGVDGHVHYLDRRHGVMGYTCVKTAIYTL